MVSTGVAKTIGGEIVTSPQMVDSTVLIAALLPLSYGIFYLEDRHAFQLLSCADRRCPRSGDNFLRYGGNQWERGFMIVAGLIGSPVIAMFSGYVIMTLLFILFRNVGRSKVNYISLHIQSLSAAVMAFPTVQ